MVLSATSLRADVPLVEQIADCVGRMSAQVEHTWLFPDTSSEPAERSREHLSDILSALTTPRTASAALARRIDAKVAHSALLTRAAFGTDPKQRHWAKRQADGQMAACHGLIFAQNEVQTVDQRTAHDSAQSPQLVNQQAVHMAERP